MVCMMEDGLTFHSGFFVSFCFVHPYGKVSSASTGGAYLSMSGEHVSHPISQAIPTIMALLWKYENLNAPKYVRRLSPVLKQSIVLGCEENANTSTWVEN